MVAVRKWVEDGEGPFLDSQSNTVRPDIAIADHDERNRNDPAKCGVHRRRGGWCGNAKGAGTNHLGYGPCKFHGGSTPNHVKRAQRQMLEAEMTTYGIPIETTAEAALTDEINRCAGHVAWLMAKVQELSDTQLVWGPAEAKRLMRTEDVEELNDDGETAGLYEVVMKAGANAWLKLYQEERTNLVRVCAIAIKAGLDERKVRLAERQGMQMSLVIRQFALEIGVPHERMGEVPDALRRALERVMGGPKVLNGVMSERVADSQVPTHSVLDL